MGINALISQPRTVEKQWQQFPSKPICHRRTIFGCFARYTWLKSKRFASGSAESYFYCFLHFQWRKGGNEVVQRILFPRRGETGKTTNHRDSFEFLIDRNKSLNGISSSIARWTHRRIDGWLLVLEHQMCIIQLYTC